MMKPRLTKHCRRDIEVMRRRSGYLAKSCAAAGVTLAIFAIAGSLLQLSIPDVHASSKNEIEAGAALFHERGCEHCHGPDARGTNNGPDLSTVGKRLTKEQIEKQIREGGLSMPAFGDALQPDQIQALVAFLHEKRKAARATTHVQKSSSAARADGPAE
jgi:mono/diheme cytochrome c family protein